MSAIRPFVEAPSLPWWGFGLSLNLPAMMLFFTPCSVEVPQHLCQYPSYNSLIFQ